VGSDIAHAVPLTLVAGVGHWLLGSVDWMLLVSLLLGSIPGVIVGAALSGKAPQGFIRTALGVVLIGSGIVTVQKGDPLVWPIAAAIAAVGLGLILAAPHWMHRRRQKEAARLALETAG